MKPSFSFSLKLLNNKYTRALNSPLVYGSCLYSVEVTAWSVMKCYFFYLARDGTVRVLTPNNQICSLGHPIL